MYTQMKTKLPGNCLTFFKSFTASTFLYEFGSPRCLIWLCHQLHLIHICLYVCLLFCRHVYNRWRWKFGYWVSTVYVLFCSRTFVRLVETREVFCLVAMFPLRRPSSRCDLLLRGAVFNCFLSTERCVVCKQQAHVIALWFCEIRWTFWAASEELHSATLRKSRVTKCCVVKCWSQLVTLCPIILSVWALL